MFEQQSPRAVKSPGLTSLSLEARLLLCTAGGPGADAAVRALLARGGEDIDWTRLLQLSITEGTQPAVGRRIRAAGGESVPPEAAAALRGIERAAEVRAAYLRRRLLDALEVLAPARIPVLLLKGAALACTTYGSFAERPMGDLDVLVEPARTEEAWSLLCAAGWSRRYDPEFDGWYAGMHHLPPLADTRMPSLGVTLELHTELFPPGHSPFALEAKELWREARPVAGLPGECFAPSPMHRLLHCCLHFTWSHMLKLSAWRAFRDVAALCAEGSFDWEELVAAAREVRGATCCYWTLRLARMLAQVPVPEGVLAALRPAGPDAVLHLLERHFTREAIASEAWSPPPWLHRLLWEAAVRPRSGGHGRRRPWQNDDLPWHRLKASAVVAPAG
jgi:hypothetical protein